MTATVNDKHTVLPPTDLEEMLAEEIAAFTAKLKKTSKLTDTELETIKKVFSEKL